jgi:DNA-binding MarR family transcriptional regulator
VSGSEVSNDDLWVQWQNLVSGVTTAERRIEQRLSDAGVPAQWFAVLRILHAAEDHQLPMNALAREASMTSGGFTKMADRMAREGLIDRRGSVNDRRVVNATLTEEGIRVATRALGVYRQALRECVLGVVSAEGLASAASTVGRLRAAYDPGAGDDVEEDVSVARSAALPDRRRQRGPADERQ